jgi:hypothetical protein
MFRMASPQQLLDWSNSKWRASGYALMVAIGILCTISTDVAGAPNELTPEEKAAGFDLLFDGNSLAAWRGYKRSDVPSGWKALDGAIAPNENSGVLYGVNEARREAHESGPEYQVADNGKDGALTINSAGGTFALYPPTKDVVKPVGEWNEGRIVVDGNHVEQWLNGEKVVSYEIRSPDWAAVLSKTKFQDKPDYGRVEDGHLALQNHGGPRWWVARLAGVPTDDPVVLQARAGVVWFRNLRVQTLPVNGGKK